MKKYIGLVNNLAIGRNATVREITNPETRATYLTQKLGNSSIRPVKTDLNLTLFFYGMIKSIRILSTIIPNHSPNWQGSQLGFFLLVFQPESCRSDLTNLLADWASNNDLQAKIPSSIYTMAKIPKDRQRTTKVLNIFVNK